MKVTLFVVTLHGKNQKPDLPADPFQYSSLQINEKKAKKIRIYSKGKPNHHQSFSLVVRGPKKNPKKKRKNVE